MRGHMHGVIIDDDFARFGAKSYAINKITSVEVRERRPHEMGCAFGLGAAAALLLVIWIASLSDQSGGGGILLVMAVLFVGLTYWQWKRAQIREYQLFLITSAAETQAFTTRDTDEVAALRSEIEGAMMRASRAGSH